MKTRSTTESAPGCSGMSAREILARMEEETRRVMLSEMLRVHEFAARAGCGVQEMRGNRDRWRAEDRTFSVEHEGVEYFPLFALDPGAGTGLFRPSPKCFASCVNSRGKAPGAGWLARWPEQLHRRSTPNGSARGRSAIGDRGGPGRGQLGEVLAWLKREWISHDGAGINGYPALLTS